MILIKAKLVRTQIEDKVYDGNSTRNYIFNCQQTDLDGSLIPVAVITKNLEVSKLLELRLSDGDFHIIPISQARVNTYSLSGKTTFSLDDTLVQHPRFDSLDISM